MKTQATIETVSLTNRRFGVEMEISGSRLEINTIVSMMAALGIGCECQSYNHRVCNVWKITTDSSIERQGGVEFGEFELVSPILCGADGVDQINKVCAVLNAAGCTVNKTCGLHVHHEVKDYKAANLARLVDFYRRAQSVIDMLMPPSRRGDTNQYCLSIPATNLCRTEDITHQYGSRYYKINIQAYYRYGTVEFRHHSGTVDAEKILAWVAFTQCMVERCRRKISESTHKLTWFDLMQAVGFTHNPAHAVTAKFLTRRYAKFTGKTTRIRVARAI